MSGKVRPGQPVFEGPVPDLLPQPVRLQKDFRQLVRKAAIVEEEYPFR
jgi:hypothetical protein